MARNPLEPIEPNFFWPIWAIRLAHAVNAILGVLRQHRTEIDDNRRRLIELNAAFDKFPEDLSEFEKDLAKQKDRINANGLAIGVLRAELAALRDLDRVRVVFKVGTPVDKPLPAHIEFTVGRPIDRPL